MKQTLLFLALSTAILLFSCEKKSNHEKVLEAKFFKNLYTQETLNKSEYKAFRDSLHQAYRDSTKGSFSIRYRMEKVIESKDSLIAPFKYTIRVGNEYIVRARNYDKIGMNIPPKKLQTIHGESIQIGGKQSKPTVLNFWFTGCKGCVLEIPSLNRLQTKYANKVNFVAMTTFDNKEDVLKFIEKKPFNFTHLASRDFNDYIKSLASYPYPETIFIDKEGTIRYIESALPPSEGAFVDMEIKYFESLIEELL